MPRVLSPIDRFTLAAAAQSVPLTHLMRTHQAAYAEGERAYFTSNLRDCPYPAESLDADAWTMGWTAERERQS